MRNSLRSLYLWGCIASITAGMYVLGAPAFLLSAPFDKQRRLGHWYATQWGHLIMAMNSRWSCEVVHGERIPRDRALVIVSNHQGVGDIMVAYHLKLHFKWISKASNFFVPFMGWFMYHAGYIPLRRGRKNSILLAMERARVYLQNGVSVLFFPEGTRSPDGVVMPFKPGAFRLALDGHFDILPVGISGTRDAIPKHSWRFSEEKAPMKIVVGDVISTQGLRDKDMQALIERTRQSVIDLKADADARIARELGQAPASTAPALV